MRTLFCFVIGWSAGFAAIALGGTFWVVALVSFFVTLFLLQVTE